MINREEFLKRTTEMVETGEQLVKVSKKLRNDFGSFEDEVENLMKNDPEFIELSDRAIKVINFLSGIDE